MARFLFTVWPFPGHVHPHLAVAKALASGGHDVAFYTGAGAKALVENEGFECFTIRRFDEAALWKRIQGLEAAAPVDKTPLKLVREVFRGWLAGTVPGQVGDVQEVMSSWRPDVVATDPMMWGPALVISETSRVPVAVMAFFLGCPIPGPESPPWGLGLPSPKGPWGRRLTRLANAANDLAGRPVRRELDRVRNEFGLPPMGCSVNAYSARLPLYLVPSVPELDFERRDLPPSVRYVGPCVWNKPKAGPSPAWLDEFAPEGGVVHATEGTAHHQDPFVLRAAAQGLAGDPAPVVLTAGGRCDASKLDLGPIADNVRVESWVSHDDLLPRCAAFVTTGGAGSVLAALSYGVPMVVVPTRWDKPDNAQRVVEAGAGLRLSPKACTPAGLREAVNRLRTEPSFGENARRIAGRLAEAGGPSHAAGLLVGLTRPFGDAPATLESLNLTVSN